MKRITINQQNRLVDALVSYSADKFTDMTWEKGRFIRLIYSAIVQAVIDARFGSTWIKKDAEDYLSGELFIEHCEMCGIDDSMMSYITINIDRLLDQVGDYDHATSDEDV